MLQGELQGSWPYQQLFMSRLLQQDPNVHIEERQSRQPNRGEYGLAYQRELYQFQQQYIDEIRIRERFRRLRQQRVPRRLYQHEQDPTLDNCLRQSEMGRQLLSLRSQMQVPQEQVQQLQQQVQRLGQCYQEQQIVQAVQPAQITEYEFSRRVIYAIWYGQS